jgi:hypothetical protein
MATLDVGGDQDIERLEIGSGLEEVWLLGLTTQKLRKDCHRGATQSSPVN